MDSRALDIFLDTNSIYYPAEILEAIPLFIQRHGLTLEILDVALEYIEHNIEYFDLKDKKTFDIVTRLIAISDEFSELLLNKE